MTVNAEDLTPQVFPPDPKTRSAVLPAQAQLTVGARAVTHGEPNRSFQYAADRWNLYLHHSLGLPLNTLSAYDVARMMADLKQARADAGDRTNHEHLADTVGYLGLAIDLEGFTPPEV